MAMPCSGARAPSPGAALPGKLWAMLLRIGSAARSGLQQFISQGCRGLKLLVAGATAWKKRERERGRERERERKEEAASMCFAVPPLFSFLPLSPCCLPEQVPQAQQPSQMGRHLCGWYSPKPKASPFCRKGNPLPRHQGFD